MKMKMFIDTLLHILAYSSFEKMKERTDERKTKNEWIMTMRATSSILAFSICTFTKSF